jgi:hypothetical protein
MDKIQLVAIEGRLYIPAHGERRGVEILVCYHLNSSDVDTIAWPDYNPKNLAGALYDAIEEGEIPDIRTVILPDGTEFDIDKNVK